MRGRVDGLQKTLILLCVLFLCQLHSSPMLLNHGQRINAEHNTNRFEVCQPTTNQSLDGRTQLGKRCCNLVTSAKKIFKYQQQTKARSGSIASEESESADDFDDFFTGEAVFGALAAAVELDVAVALALVAAVAVVSLSTFLFSAGRGAVTLKMNMEEHTIHAPLLGYRVEVQRLSMQTL